MKKLPDTAHNNKIAKPSFHIYKFPGETDLPVNDSLLKSKSFRNIVRYGSSVTYLYLHPFNYRINGIVKRITDIFLSSLIIIFILSWLIPIVAVLIKLNSKGPIFFLQKRNKKNGEVFNCIKFRSMVVNEEADIMPALEDDKRITAIGRFLRRYYIDELPQLFNVFWGDMSLVGPRPHMISDNLRYDFLIKNYAYRHTVKPGITGLSQVMGYTGATADIKKMEKRINMDIFYVRHWSFKLDMFILYKTLFKSKS